MQRLAQDHAASLVEQCALLEIAVVVDRAAQIMILDAARSFQIAEIEAVIGRRIRPRTQPYTSLLVLPRPRMLDQAIEDAGLDQRLLEQLLRHPGHRRELVRREHGAAFLAAVLKPEIADGAVAVPLLAAQGLWPDRKLLLEIIHPEQQVVCGAAEDQCGAFLAFHPFWVVRAFREVVLRALGEYPAQPA